MLPVLDLGQLLFHRPCGDEAAPARPPGFAATLVRRDGSVIHDTAGRHASLVDLQPGLADPATPAIERTWPGGPGAERVYAAVHPLHDALIGRELGWSVVVREPADAIHAAVVQALDEAVKRGWNSWTCVRCQLMAMQPGETEADDHRHERFARQANDAHEPIHHECGSCHIAGIFQQSDESKEDHDLGDKHQDPAKSRHHTIDEQITPPGIG